MLLVCSLSRAAITRYLVGSLPPVWLVEEMGILASCHIRWSLCDLPKAQVCPPPELHAHPLLKRGVDHPSPVGGRGGELRFDAVPTARQKAMCSLLEAKSCGT